ncbi:MAG: OB-fold domain-containing protein [Patescibacteria group bacterium]
MLSPVKLWRNQKNVGKMLGKIGKIISWTMVRVPPADFSDQAPYPVVLVELSGGERITAQLVDPPAGGQAGKEKLMGMKVITVVRRTIKPNNEGVIPYGIKVKPC